MDLSVRDGATVGDHALRGTTFKGEHVGLIACRFEGTNFPSAEFFLWNDPTALGAAGATVAGLGITGSNRPTLSSIAVTRGTQGTGGSTGTGGAPSTGASVSCSKTPLTGGTTRCSTNAERTVGAYNWFLWSNAAAPA